MLLAPTGNFYIGMSECVKWRMLSHLAPSAPNARFNSVKVICDIRHWRMISVLECPETTPLTIIHITEAILIALSDANGSSLGCNVNLFDTSFFKCPTIPGMSLDRRLLCAVDKSARIVLEFMDAVTAHVDSGGLLPGSPTRHNDQIEKWNTLFGQRFPLTPSMMYGLVRARIRRITTIPYFKAFPIPDRAWMLEIAQEPLKSTKKVAVKRKSETEAQRDERKKSFGLGKRK